MYGLGPLGCDAFPLSLLIYLYYDLEKILPIKKKCNEHVSSTLMNKQLMRALDDGSGCVRLGLGWWEFFFNIWPKNYQSKDRRMN